VRFRFDDPTRDLAIGNIPYHLSERDVFDLASQFAVVLRVCLITNRETGLSRGHGFLRFATEADAARAMKALNGLAVETRVLVARPAVPSARSSTLPKEKRQ
jgi:RNA recognition motif-containing protein